jgi:hypothetical protein
MIHGMIISKYLQKEYQFKKTIIYKIKTYRHYNIVDIKQCNDKLMNSITVESLKFV